MAEAGLDLRGVPLRLVTLGKALGGYGAVVAGDADLVRHLAETARQYIYTTALPPALAAATLAAVKLARREEWRRDKLSALVARFRNAARQHGLDPAQMALAFVMSRPFVLSTIIGCTSVKQLEQDAAAAALKLSPELLAAIDAIHAENPNPAP